MIRLEKKFILNVFSNFSKSKLNMFLISPKSPIAFIIRLVSLKKSAYLSIFLVIDFFF